MGSEIRVREEQSAIAPQGELSVGDLIAQVTKVRTVMDTVMRKDTHYGLIPGCGDKPTLFKAGAEKLALVFRLAPAFDVRKTELPNWHREYEVVCTLTHIPTGATIAQGIGVCSTMESKYRYRGGSRKCPACGKAAIKVSKYPPRGAPRDTPQGFYCYAKIGGCGVEFPHDDSKITSQSEGRVENPDIADIYNTVVKMAKKRAQVDATLTATGASDILTQDLEDLAEAAVAHPPTPVDARPSRAPIAERVRKAAVVDPPHEDRPDDFPPDESYVGEPATPSPFNRNGVLRDLMEESVRGQVGAAAKSLGLALAKSGDLRALSDTDLARLHDEAFNNPLR